RKAVIFHFVLAATRGANERRRAWPDEPGRLKSSPDGQGGAPRRTGEGDAYRISSDHLATWRRRAQKNGRPSRPPISYFPAQNCGPKPRRFRSLARLKSARANGFLPDGDAAEAAITWRGFFVTNGH